MYSTLWDILLYDSCWSVHMRHYLKTYYTTAQNEIEVIVWGKSSIVLQCFFAPTWKLQHTFLGDLYRILYNWMFRHLEPFWVHLDLILSVAHLPNAPTIKFKQLLPRLFIIAILTLVIGIASTTPSNSVLMRQLLRKHLDRARCTSGKPHIGSGDRGPQPFADPDSLFLGMSRCSACNHAKFISWTSQSSFLCKATCSTYTLARSNAARYSRSTQAAQTWTQKLR